MFHSDEQGGMPARPIKVPLITGLSKHVMAS